MSAFFSLSSLLVLLVFSFPLPGPQGEGLLAPDTPIQLADGSIKNAADLAKGDILKVWDDTENRWTTSRVKTVARNNARVYWALKTATTTLRGSANLWVVVAPGKLSPVSRVTVGTSIFSWGETKPVGGAVLNLREYPTNLPLFNIDLETPGLFVASGFLVHD